MWINAEFSIIKSLSSKAKFVPVHYVDACGGNGGNFGIRWKWVGQLQSPEKESQVHIEYEAGLAPESVQKLR
jgi:hypothetical protein